MSRRFEDLFDVLDYNELMRSKIDLDSGAITLKRIVGGKDKKRSKDHEKVCATCSGDLNFYRTQATILWCSVLMTSRKRPAFAAWTAWSIFMIKAKV